MSGLVSVKIPAYRLIAEDALNMMAEIAPALTGLEELLRHTPAPLDAARVGTLLGLLGDGIAHRLERARRDLDLPPP